MTECKRSVDGYNRLSYFYRLLEFVAFGRALDRARVSLLLQLPELDSLLSLGDGDGRFLSKFLEGQPNCRVTSIDQSSAMIRLQRRRIPKSVADALVDFQVADVGNVCFERGRFNAVSVLFFLDCFSEKELTRLLERVIPWVAPGGFVYFADFVLPKSGWQRIRARFYIRVMHLFFRWCTGLENNRLVDIASCLEKLELALIEERFSNLGLIRTAIYRVN